MKNVLRKFTRTEFRKPFFSIIILILADIFIIAAILGTGICMDKSEASKIFSSWEKIICYLATIALLILIFAFFAAAESAGTPAEAEAAGLMFIPFIGMIITGIAYLIWSFGLYGWEFFLSLATGHPLPEFFHFTLDSPWKMALRVLGFYCFPFIVLMIIDAILEENENSTKKP